MRTRPPKKNSELLQKLINSIRKDHTVTDTCRSCGISTTTFNHWRDEDLQFNKDVILATKEQWKYVEDTKFAKHRTYTRKAIISPDYDQNALKTPQNEPQSHLKDIKPTMIEGLPVRYGNIYDDNPYTPCISPDGLFVSFIEVKGSCAYHRCYCLSEWQRMRNE